jgi:hypothetical protein
LVVFRIANSTRVGADGCPPVNASAGRRAIRIPLLPPGPVGCRQEALAMQTITLSEAALELSRRGRFRADSQSPRTNSGEPLALTPLAHWSGPPPRTTQFLPICSGHSDQHEKPNRPRSLLVRCPGKMGATCYFPGKYGSSGNCVRRGCADINPHATGG